LAVRDCAGRGDDRGRHADGFEHRYEVLLDRVLDRPRGEARLGEGTRRGALARRDAVSLGEREQQVLRLDLRRALAARDVERPHDGAAAVGGEALKHRVLLLVARRARPGAWRASCERPGG